MDSHALGEAVPREGDQAVEAPPHPHDSLWHMSTNLSQAIVEGCRQEDETLTVIGSACATGRSGLSYSLNQVQTNRTLQGDEEIRYPKHEITVNKFSAPGRKDRRTEG